MTFEDVGIRLWAGATGQVKTTCPQCSAARKKSGEKCLSVNVELGVWSCKHCGWEGGLGRGGAPLPKVYRRPEPRPQIALPENALAWFRSRAITTEVLIRNRIDYGRVFFPQLGAEAEALVFPYFRDGIEINRKYRTLDKQFRMEAGCELILYGLDDLDPEEPAIWVEGECFPGEAEVLTPEGWVRLDTWKNQPVLQVSQSMTGQFVRPSVAVRKDFRGQLVRHEKRGWFSLTTPDHMLVSRDIRGRLRKTAAKDFPPSSSDRTPRAVDVDGPGICLTDDQIALCLAVSADAAIREKGYRGRYAVCGFRRARKTARLTAILGRLGIKASATKIKGGYDSVCFHLPVWVPGRELPWSWVAKASRSQREFILAELVEWDGNRVRGRNQAEFSSKIEANAAWVQAMAHTSGRVSTMIRRKNALGEWWKVSILHGKRDNYGQNITTTRVPYDGPVFCLTVPSGMLLVRQARCVGVSGNCDKLALEVAGFRHVVSVPNGAPPPGAKGYSGKFGYLDASGGLLEAISRHTLGVDSDLAGRALEGELARRLGVERCSRIRWPAGCKDANDVLVKYGPGEVRRCVEAAEPYPLEGVFGIGDLRDDVLALYENGLERGVSTGWAELDRLYTVRPGELTVVTGIPSSGKSNLVDALLVNLARMHGWRFAVFSPENLPLEQHMASVVEKYAGAPFHDGYRERMGRDELSAAMSFADEHFSWIMPSSEDDWTLEKILDAAGKLCFRRGIRGLVVDPWNELEGLRPDGMSETDYVSWALKRIRVFARARKIHVWVVVHPQKLKRQENGKYPIPTLYDCSGSAHWRNKADNGIVVWRDLAAEDSAEVQVHVQKIRFRHVGRRGMAKLYYESPTATYRDPSWSDQLGGTA